MKPRPISHGVVGLLALMACSCGALRGADRSMDKLLALAGPNDKPFVIVGNDGDGKGQGVVISSTGYILTAAHVTYDEKADANRKEITVSFRKDKPDPWPGMFHEHRITVVDAGHPEFTEEDYKARLIQQSYRRITRRGRERESQRAQIDGKDVALLKLDTTAALPHVEFYSKKEPPIRLGDHLYLCQYVFPTSKSDPIFLISPIEVIGVAKNTTGIQYLAEGFFRWGSSGGAILKDGKLIGIQSNGYTVNSPAGEISLGHISFQVVYEDMLDSVIKPGTLEEQTPAPAPTAPPAPAESTEPAQSAEQGEGK